MNYSATCVCGEPLDYFLRPGEAISRLRISDVILRYNQNPKEVFSQFIRMASDSKWSHSALLYLLSDPHKGFTNTYLVEAMTTGVRVASWRNEVVPYKQFTVGIKRPLLDWYVETPYEQSLHRSQDPEDTHGIDYLRHVRGIALDQINGLYDRKTVFEIASLYIERVAMRRFSKIPQIAKAAEVSARFFRAWDESTFSHGDSFRFMCSGLVQYSFFEALRRRIVNDLAIPEHRDAALSNLSNMRRVVFRDDPEGTISEYVEQVLSGKLDIADPLPNHVISFLKTALPADFNNSENLQWRYVIRQGMVWEVNEAACDYKPQSKAEQEVLALLAHEQCDCDRTDAAS